MNTKVSLFVGIILVFAVVFTMTGCDSLFGSDDDDKSSESLPEEYQGLPEQIREIIPVETIQVAENELDQVINRGNNPPVFDNSYFVSPVILTKTNVPNDFVSPGARFADIYLRFSDQNTQNQTLRVDMVETNISNGNVLTESEGLGAYISGEGNKFTIFTVVETTTSGGEKSEVFYIYSGELQSNGIKNFTTSLIMLNNNGHTNIFIPNNTGRAFRDGSEFAAETSMPSTNQVQSMSLYDSDIHFGSGR